MTILFDAARRAKPSRTFAEGLVNPAPTLKATVEPLGTPARPYEPSMADRLWLSFEADDEARYEAWERQCYIDEQMAQVYPGDITDADLIAAGLPVG
jgi:hypothetical protein